MASSKISKYEYRQWMSSLRSLNDAPEHVRGDKCFILEAVQTSGGVLQLATPNLQNDKEVVLTACSHHGRALEFASQELRNDKEVVSSACSRNGYELEHASPQLQNDKEVVLVACSQKGSALQFVSPALKDDKEVVLVACSQEGSALQFASQQLQINMEVVLSACCQNGTALQFASNALRADKEVVMTVVELHPESLKFALGGLNQNKDCLIKAGIWDKDYAGGLAQIQKRKIVLSTRFSLAAESSPHATIFAVELKGRPYIADNNFVVYSPNAFNKKTCDPEWTNRNWPCRGTFSSCQFPQEYKTGVPQDDCCWRYSFRHHLQEAYQCGGCMIQVVDSVQGSSNHSLGDGQTIEEEMAQDLGIKIFRFYENISYGYRGNYAGKVDAFVSQIQNWYEDECINTP